MIRWYYYISRWAVIAFFKLFTSWRTEGLDNVPSGGPVLLVSNHLSNADPPLVSVTLKRNAIFMAKKELFINPVLGYLVYGLGAFPVNRGQLDRQAIRHSEKVLKENKILVMFPEAARSKEGRMKEAYPGSALIAARNNVPIVPVAITGTEKVVGLKWMLHRPRVLIRFGKPFSLPPREQQKKRENMGHSTRIIMEHIAEMLPEKYRGVYSKQGKTDESAD
jgi:1-acyl-sn-glycerol-3-phosphate acyltransferase